MKHDEARKLVETYAYADEAALGGRSPLWDVLEYLDCICPKGWTEITYDEWMNTKCAKSAETVDGRFYGPGEDWPEGCRGPLADGDTHHYRFFKKS